MRRIIVRFTAGTPDANTRLEPIALHDRINAAMAGTGALASSAQFTRAGNIAVTPLAPCTVEELLRYEDRIKLCAAHGQPLPTLIVEPDSPWPSVVVHGVRVPSGGDMRQMESALSRELREWNPVMRMGVKDVRIMCKPSETRRIERGAVRIAFASQEGCQQALKVGICAFGESLRAVQYRVTQERDTRSRYR